MAPSPRQSTPFSASWIWGNRLEQARDELAADSKLYGSITSYFDLLKDYMGRQELYSFVHAKGYF